MHANLEDISRIHFEFSKKKVPNAGHDNSFQRHLGLYNGNKLSLTGISKNNIFYEIRSVSVYEQNVLKYQTSYFQYA